MEFEIFNDKGNRVFYTHQEQCIPTKSQISSMSKQGYKFKIDGKNISKTKALEMARKD